VDGKPKVVSQVYVGSPEKVAALAKGETGQDGFDRLIATVPFPKRGGNPKDFAKLACHIVENTMMNGECIRIDGAMRMGLMI